MIWQERNFIIEDLGSFAERNSEFRKTYTINKSSIGMPCPLPQLSEGNLAIIKFGTPLSHGGRGVGGEETLNFVFQLAIEKDCGMSCAIGALGKIGNCSRRLIAQFAIEWLGLIALASIKY